LQFLRYCVGELTYTEIAQRMGATTKAVEGYRDSLFKKLDTHSRTSLALYAVQFGIVQLDINISKTFCIKSINSTIKRLNF